MWDGFLKWLLGHGGSRLSGGNGKALGQGECLGVFKGQEEGQGTGVQSMRRGQESPGGKSVGGGQGGLVCHDGNFWFHLD